VAGKATHYLHGETAWFLARDGQTPYTADWLAVSIEKSLASKQKAD
jgi:hypothetical protein